MKSNGTWDPDDLPDTYYLLGTVHGFRFILDIQEGERVGALLDNYQTSQGVHTAGFLHFKDFTDGPVRVQYELIDAFFVSSPESRTFEEALSEKYKKNKWNSDNDD